MNGLGSRLLFVLSLWMSLVTAIVCAVVPAGLPATKSVGSAFDPSTTIVALRSRPPASVKATVLHNGEGDGGDVGSGPTTQTALAAVAIIGAVILTPATGILPSILALVPRAIPIALYARPPPIT